MNDELPADAADVTPLPGDTPSSAGAPVDEGSHGEAKGTSQRMEQLKPYAVAAEDAAYQVVKASQKGLNWLAGFLGERHDRRATTDETGQTPPATDEPTPPVTPEPPDTSA